MGALISGLATVLAGSFGGGSQTDAQNAQLQLAHQNARLNSATQLAAQAGDNYQRSVENQLGSLSQAAQIEQQASMGKLQGFQNALLGRF